MRAVMRSRLQANKAATRLHNSVDPSKQVPYESTRISNLDRFKDEPEPTADDMIVTHYLKHHPMYEFRELEEIHVDGYRHWLHARGDYYNTETYPAAISPWEQGSKTGHLFFLLFPLFSFYFFGN